MGVSPEEIQTEPKVAVRTELGDVEFHFDPDTYEKFVGIGSTLRLESEIWRLLQTDKSLLIKDSKKIDTAFCYSEKSGKWRLHYVILSGAYIYVYETNKQPYPTAYYYLSNASVKDEGKSEALGLYLISVSSEYGTFQLGYRREDQKADWLKLLADYIKEFYEPQAIVVPPTSEKQRRPPAHNIECVLARADSSFPSVALNLHNPDGSDWVRAKLIGGTFGLTVRPEDFSAFFRLEKLQFILASDKQVPFTGLLSCEGEEALPAVDCSVKCQTKRSPNYHVFPHGMSLVGTAVCDRVPGGEGGLVVPAQHGPAAHGLLLRLLLSHRQKARGNRPV